MTNPYISAPWTKHYPEGIDWETPIEPKPLHSLLEDSVAEYPNNIALDFYGKEYTYEKLGDMVNRVANGLQDMGVGPETRVGLFMPNCPQYVMAYYAILKAGGTVVNFNPLYSEEEINHQINDANVEYLITLNLRSLYNKVKPFVGKGKLKKVVMGYLQEAMPLKMATLFTVAKAKEMMLNPGGEYHASFNELLAYEPTPKLVPIAPTEQVAVLQYTGGTTGLPKGAVLTHYNLYANATQCSLWMHGLEPGKEVMLAILPFFHVFAMTVSLNLAIKQGAKIVIHPRFELKHVLSDIQEKKPTLMPGVSTLFATINNYKKLDNYDLSSIKMCISGGGPLAVEVKQQFEKLTGCKLVEGYGLTESSPVTHCNPLFPVRRHCEPQAKQSPDGDRRVADAPRDDEYITKTASIGPPFPGTIAEVINPDDKTTPMPIGEVGEICIRGPQVMRGYLNNAEETTGTLRFGRLHTGDLGYMDEDGYFYIVDRLKEMIICGGYNVYPRNVEEVIYQHEAVAECAVLGIDDSRRGQAIKAFIVLKDGAQEPSSQEMKDFCREHMSAYSVPHKIEYRKELPKSPVGKILKKELVKEEKEKSTS